MAKKQPPPDDLSFPGKGEYTVVARRYRPQQFADLVGQESVAKALTNAIQSGRVAHAYLFTGARGVGKTSAARILAKALNCVTGPTPTPCDKCDSCKAIAAGEDIDVLEIDGASNRGIDEVRAIRNSVATRPQRGRYKVYIIDEVHMLTAPAFNALLKTLEEPPPHVKFIFATTEVQKIPITILSRCQRFDFGGINAAKILNRLKEVVAGEGMRADEEALRIVARRAGGSMRDAQSLLEQLLSFGGDRLTADAVHAMLGTAADDRVVDIAAAILGKDPRRALELVARCADEGLQLGELLDQLIDYWRGLLLVNCTGGEGVELNVADHHKDTVRQQSAALALDTILAGLDVLTTTKARLRTTSHGQVLLEVAVVRLSRLDELVPVSQLAQWLGQPGSTLATGGRPGPTVPAASPGSADVSKKNGTTGLAEAFRAGSNGPAIAAVSGPTVTPIGDANLFQAWDKVKIGAGIMLAGELAKGIPAISGPKTLVLRFPGQYNHAYEYCRDAGPTIEGLVRQVTGQDWAVRFEVDASVAAEPVAPPISSRERERRILEAPLLSRIVERLDGRLLRMDEGFGDDMAGDAATENGDRPAEPAA
ncbi:MAG TPA: DNA polymerase III subunit gamma/tau [Gemmataceae bacterium]|nr:DNA polymerase III subunit gamma/tau [Gemmataceae bacterium]